MTKNRLTKEALLISNHQIAKGIYAMELFEPESAVAAQPGQFIMVAAGDGPEPFLRRPFSIAGMDGDRGVITLIYQETGKGTRMMAAWAPGKRVDFLGPLGNGFSPEDEAPRALLAGGGMGIAPLLPLAKKLRARGKEVYLFLGAKSMDLIFGLLSLHEYGCEVRIATEDGSGGVTGLATLPLERYLKESCAGHTPGLTPPTSGESSPGPLYACGPAPYLKAVAGLCGAYRLEAQLSLEARMGCGIGVCLGCGVQIRTPGGTGSKRVCCDGPVFRAEEVIFDG